MTSREFAKQLIALAEFLTSKPEFNIPHASRIFAFYWDAKADFLDAVKAVGAGKKKYDSTGDLEFTPTAAPLLALCASRNMVCRKVQEEKWECEPLLSQAEEAALDQAV